MDAIKKRSENQERVTNLYLRLNGYFQTGLILHSQDWGENLGELDVLAIRMGKHTQEERQIDCDQILEIDSEFNVDLVICEVKNKKISFNKSLLNDNTSEFAWYQIASWSGLFTDDEIDTIVTDGKEIVNTDKDSISSLAVESESFGKIRIRAILFHFEENDNDVGFLTITGQQMYDYIWKCLAPEVIRETCSTSYPYTMWGSEFMDIVKYVKDKVKNGDEQGDIHSLLDNL